MKKDRNSFFQQYGMSAMNTNNPQPFMYPNMNNNVNSFDYDIDARLNKIERELQRIDARLTKLESGMINNSNNTSTDYNFANSMYMV